MFSEVKKTCRIAVLLTALSLVFLFGCARTLPAGESGPSVDITQAEPFVPAADGSNYLEPVYRNYPPEEMEAVAADNPPALNPFPTLSVPTWITKIGETWFLVDCYHNQILYNDASDALSEPLGNWRIMTGDVTQPHTVAGDGEVYLVDDTENNRVLVFERVGDAFVNTQTFWNIGNRPHYTVYDRATDTFYVWSSLTGELYLFRRAKDTRDIYETEIRRIPSLDGVYVRSFTIDGDRIYFVSGVCPEDAASYTPAILCCDLKTLEILERYDVPDSVAGMAQVTKDPDGGWYITVSTDAAGNQDACALLHADSLADLTKGDYTDIYSRFFVGGGTPYYISRIGDSFFLTELRLRDHGIWRFSYDKKAYVKDVEAIY